MASCQVITEAGGRGQGKREKVVGNSILNRVIMEGFPEEVTAE